MTAKHQIKLIDLTLSELPASHPLRNLPLSEIRAEYRWIHGKQWKQIEEHWKIAQCTYNQLGSAWTEFSIWRAYEDTHE